MAEKDWVLEHLLEAYETTQIQRVRSPVAIEAKIDVLRLTLAQYVVGDTLCDISLQFSKLYEGFLFSLRIGHKFYGVYVSYWRQHK